MDVGIKLSTKFCDVCNVSQKGNDNRMRFLSQTLRTKLDLSQEEETRQKVNKLFSEGTF